MNISRRLYTSLIIFLAIIVVILLVVFNSTRSFNQRIDLSNQSVKIARNVFELSLLSEEYTLNQSRRSVDQWFSLFQSITQELKQAYFFNKETAQKADAISNKLTVLENIFNQMSQQKTLSVKSDLVNLLSNQMRVQTRDIYSKAIELSDRSEESRQALRKTTDQILFALLIALGLTVMIGGVAVSRSIGKSATDLEKAMAKDEAMLASIGDGLIFTDPKGKIVLMNRVAENLLGFNQKDAFGIDCTRIVNAKDKQGNPITSKNLPLTKVLESDTLVNTTTIMDSYHFTSHDGQVFPVTITASKVLLKNELIGAVVVFRDITKENEIDKAKSEFVSLASHQLRTPLSAINWYSEMLLNEDVGEITSDQKKYLEEIYQGNRRMVELVNALLNVSRIELGTFTVEPAMTNTIKLAKEVINEQKKQIEEKRLYLKEEFAKNIPLFNVDPKLLWIVIQNLVSNAVKYTPDHGKIIIAIEVKKRGEVYGERKIKEECICITVADNGWGIPQTQQDKIFTKLFRADNVKEKDTEGTGLGLYIVKSIVNHSLGDIWFQSKEGQGTTFYITLPTSGMKKKEGTKKLG